jgi:zinc transport system substrate-binding protein
MCKVCPKQKKALAFFIAIIGALFGFYTIFSYTMKPSLPKKPAVIVSTFALYDISRAVAGDTLEIKTVVPLGSDAHAYSPTPSDIAIFSKASLFFINGSGFEGWVENLKNTLPASVHIVDMSLHVGLLDNDPHYWLNIDNMIEMTWEVQRQFSALSPTNKALYQANGDRHREALQKLKQQYAVGLKECKNRTLVTNHNAFGYLAYSNDLKNISIIGLSSDEQPSAKKMAEITTLMQKEKISTIFFEETIDDNVAQTIAKSSGAIAQSLQPLENITQAEFDVNATYISIMENNLMKLRNAMECR